MKKERGIGERGEEEGVREGESRERSEREWEKCDILPANGDAASHAPGRRSISAAGHGGLDMTFPSAVACAHLPL